VQNIIGPSSPLYAVQMQFFTTRERVCDVKQYLHAPTVSSNGPRVISDIIVALVLATCLTDEPARDFGTATAVAFFAGGVTNAIAQESSATRSTLPQSQRSGKMPQSHRGDKCSLHPLLDRSACRCCSSEEVWHQ